ncbi:MAG TPA: glutamine amidotransferase [Tepidisphaeraceae bacterium]|nr:glutamine amidotransferase [Tepidisphaeraceae bacterium]
MNEWSIDILRQGPWDLWTWICLLASAVLLVYGVIARAWLHSQRALLVPLITAGVLGTLLVVALPPLRNPKVGLVWTLALLCILSTVFYLNLQSQLSSARWRTLLAMRYVALILLVPMLFEPVVRYVSRPAPEKPLIFLIDTSASMSFPDVQNGPTRLQSVWQALRGQLPELREHFVPEFHTFADTAAALKSPEQLATLPAEGQSTDIGNGVSKAMAANARAGAEIVLITDGIDNTSPNVADVISASRRPIHTVRVGSDQAQPTAMANLSVDDVQADDDFVVNHTATVRATLHSSALANRVVDVKLAEVDADGKPLTTPTVEKLVLQPLPGGQIVELAYKPTRVGVHRLAVWVDPIPGERSTVDNRQEFQGLAIDPRVKVLYVEGRARPEYRELSRALSRDPNIELATLLRIQNDRFAAGGFVDAVPFKEMPQSLEQWQRFDVVILGDLDSSFLPRPQQAAIEQAVQGGMGLLMVGGQTNFGPGGYKDTPIEKALPVFTGELSAPQEKVPFVPKLTADGSAHPAMAGLSEWLDGDAATKLPPLRGNVVVPRPKTGAQVLLIHEGRTAADGQPQIVLATHRYGEGRAAACTVDTTYLWYLPLRAMGQDSPYNRFWGQLVRWLANSDVRNRDRGPGLEALLNKNVFQLGESVRVRAMVRDEKGDATRYAQVSLAMTAGSASEQTRFSMAPSETRSGMYDVTIPTPAKGDYELSLTATKDGKDLGQQKLKFSVITPADEMLKLAANPELLKSVASRTNGFYYELSQFGTMVSELVRTSAGDTGMKQQTVPLHSFARAAITATAGDPGWDKKYDLPLQGVAAVCILGVEWFLRRRWQLP